MVSKTRLILSDFVVSLMWVWSGSLIKIFVFKVLGMGHDSRGEFLKNSLSIVNMFLFAFLGKVTKGGTYNPLTILSSAISGDFSQFLFTIGARIPAQVRFSLPVRCDLVLFHLDVNWVCFVCLKCEENGLYCSLYILLCLVSNNGFSLNNYCKIFWPVIYFKKERSIYYWEEHGANQHKLKLGFC